MKFAEQMFAYHRAESEFTDLLVEAGFGEFVSISGDDYDGSIEIYKTASDARLSDAAQRIIYDAGFIKAYVNHDDGWETHYGFDLTKPFEPHRGWRRKSVKDGFLISYWPEGWGDPKTGKCANWLQSGYMKIVSESDDESPTTESR